RPAETTGMRPGDAPRAYFSGGTMIDTAPSRPSVAETLAVKVPEITALFWLIKILTTGMGEAASDFTLKISAKLGGQVGIDAAIFVCFVAFSIALWLQFRARRYYAPTYWLSVSMVAVFGTIAADE